MQKVYFWFKSSLSRVGFSNRSIYDHALVLKHEPTLDFIFSLVFFFNLDVGYLISFVLQKAPQLVDFTLNI